MSIVITRYKNILVALASSVVSAREPNLDRWRGSAMIWTLEVRHGQYEYWIRLERPLT